MIKNPKLFKNEVMKISGVTLEYMRTINNQLYGCGLHSVEGIIGVKRKAER